MLLINFLGFWVCLYTRCASKRDVLLNEMSFYFYIEKLALSNYGNQISNQISLNPCLHIISTWVRETMCYTYSRSHHWHPILDKFWHPSFPLPPYFFPFFQKFESDPTLFHFYQKYQLDCTFFKSFLKRCSL